MSIKPIDFQVQIPKTTEISRTNSHDAQKNLTFQQQQATLTQQLAEGTLTKVYQHDKTHNTAIREKQKENEKRKEKEDDKNKNDKGKITKGNDLNEPIKTSTIDIKI